MRATDLKREIETLLTRKDNGNFYQGEITLCGQKLSPKQREQYYGVCQHKATGRLFTVKETPMGVTIALVIR